MSKSKKKILLIGELYKPLIPWFLESKVPQGVPGVYNLYKYLGDSEEYTFYSIVYNPKINFKREFENGSVLELKKFAFPTYYLWKLFVFFKLIFWGNKKLKNESFDLVYGLSTFSTIAAYLGRKHKIPSVGRIYGTILTKDVKNRNYFKLYTRFFFDVLAIKYPADHVISTLDGTAYDRVFAHFNKKKKVQLYYNGMEEGLRSSLLAQKNTAILSSKKTIHLCYIARLETYKRIELGIGLVEYLVNTKQVKNIKLSILGNGSQEKQLQALVRNKKLGDYTEFIAEMPHENLASFIEKQDAALFLYEGGSLGNILWECALAGKLILTVDNGDTAKLFKDGENCLMAKDDQHLIDELGEKLVQLIDKDISGITLSGRQTVEEKVGTWNERFDREFQKIFG